jgi:hypothetical protein
VTVSRHRALLISQRNLEGVIADPWSLREFLSGWLKTTRSVGLVGRMARARVPSRSASPAMLKV